MSRPNLSPRTLALRVVLLSVAAGVGCLMSATDPATPQVDRLTPAPPTAHAPTDGALARAYAHQESDVQVRGHGRVVHILPDDNEGSRHQRFVLELPDGQTVLIAHNIDLAPRIDPLERGDSVGFAGEYEWNDRGGVVHWTHRDSARRHEDGWLESGGRRFE